MAVPKFEYFLYPFLKHLASGDMDFRSMKKAIVKDLKISDEDCDLMTKAGKKTQVDDRISWARQYLKEALFINVIDKTTYRITKRGRDYLKTHSSLLKSDLMQYPEFVEYAYRNNKEKNGTTRNKYEATGSVSEFTPDEQIMTEYEEINSDLEARVFEKVVKMSPRSFEFLIKDLLLALGYGGQDKHAEVTQYSHDDGVDGLTFEDKLGFEKILYQAKHISPENKVDINDLKAFSGTLDQKNTNKGVFITTGSFTSSADKFVATIPKKIILIDGKKLAHLMVEYGIGVSVYKTLYLKRIDLDYFNEEDY
jgi:restriction system protein